MGDDRTRRLLDVAKLAGFVAAQRADPRFVPGVLEPGPEPEADIRIDPYIWQAVLTMWHASQSGPLSSEAKMRSHHLVEAAINVWRSSGRMPDDVHGLHPVQQLALERLGTVGQRAQAGAPLRPELDTLDGDAHVTG